MLPGQSEAFIKQLLRMVFRYAGEPQTEDVVEDIYQEAIESLVPNANSSEPCPK